jgi:hypothetical protein
MRKVWFLQSQEIWKLLIEEAHKWARLKLTKDLDLTKTMLKREKQV